MCGIVGCAAISSQAERAWLAPARDAMTHRGPDDAGEWWSSNGRVGFAHRRLSILDLSLNGHQPMHMPEHGLSVVFNGEIYNFRELYHELEGLGIVFRSTSDTEVLLAAYSVWGEECLSRLNGMFAFALYDAVRGKLFLARDRAGEKPLFYCHHQGVLYFASELKALMSNPSLPRVIDPDALDCYLAMGFVPGAHCILSGYHKLAPANAMSFNLRDGATRVWQYWAPPSYGQQDDGRMADEAQLVAELEGILSDAVGRQLVADVPVGVLLSGGVDSSLVTAMAVRHSSRVRTFSIGFPGYGKHDETAHARKVAEYFGTQHTELMAEPATADLIPMLARQFDEPMVDSSMIPTWLVSHLVRQYCTVALGGDGADELFGGYAHYGRLLGMHRLQQRVPFILLKALGVVGSRVFPEGFRGRNYLEALGTDTREGLPLIVSHFSRESRRKLLRNHPRYASRAEMIRNERIPRQYDMVQRATRMDFSDYLAEDILVKVDRASMLNSLEMRAPFLDRHLIEFAFSRVPSRLKSTVSGKKILLKRVAARVLPADFDLQRKQGFSIPLNEWLKGGPFRDFFWDTLLSSGGIFNRQAVEGLLKGQDRGLSNGERLFSLVLFDLWSREYRVGF